MWCSRLTTQEELQASLLGAMRLPVTADSKVGRRLTIVFIVGGGGDGGCWKWWCCCCSASAGSC